ncbi:MAG: alpha/beta hydrolase [Bacteroidota bacterium]|nr:alpha/beta hydrolase [Bacteroidota bacterium]
MKQLRMIVLVVLLLQGCVASKKTPPIWKTLPEIPVMPSADEIGFLPVNDINMYYAIFNKQGKEPVILLHGGFGNADWWGYEVPLLSKTHQVIILDNRGHGRSTMSDQAFSYQLMASDVLQLMDQLHLQKVSIVGWSDGGIIGLVLAMKHPDRIDKLFTYGTNFKKSGEKSEPMDSATGAKFMTKVRADYHKLSPTPDDFLKFRAALGKMYSTEPNLIPAEIKTIKAPTVIAAGQYEQFYKREHFEELAGLIPNAICVILPNVSHGGPIQNPAQFHKAVMKLLDGHH